MQIDDLRLIVTISQLGSFAEAADHLGMSRPNASKRIKHIEKELQARIFARTTRYLSLTSQGEEILRHAKKMLAEYDELAGFLNSSGAALVGHVVVDAIDLTSPLLCKQVLPEFIASYPQVKITVRCSGEFPEHVKSRADIMVHINPIKDSGYINEPLVRCRRLFVATPDYLARHGQPSHPQDLSNYPCVLPGYSRHPSSEWMYLEEGVEKSVLVRGNLDFDDLESSLLMTLSHQGVCWLPDFLCQKYLDSGELVEVFDYRFNIADTVYVIYAEDELLPQAIRLFVDCINRNFSLVDFAGVSAGD